MLARVKTATLVGVRGYGVTVEADLYRGMPGFNVVGLADTTIKESFQRIKPAIINSEFDFPNEKVTINLVPAGKPKEGSHFDLPMALGIIALREEIEVPEDTAFFGEVSLDGRVNGIRGALPLAISARNSGLKKVVLPMANSQEVSALEDISIYPVSSLKEAVRYIKGEITIEPYHEETLQMMENYALDFNQVVGQESVKRALMISAAGKHGILMVGGPGCGKTMMARRLPTILPPLSYEEKLEITGIYSVAGILDEENPIVTTRPFRSPHHTITSVGLTGGGRPPRPGELSLAHRGVLFLDELGEFDSRVIDSMRQPIEEGIIRVNRHLEEITFPSQVMVVVAANPCKCGNLWDERKRCTCTSKQLDSHKRKLTGPFSDRIDIHVKVNSLTKSDIEGLRDNVGMSSAFMRSKVMEAREIQAMRYKNMKVSYNGELDDSIVRDFTLMDKESINFMNQAYERMNLTMRAYVKVLKIARTIADIDGKEEVQMKHLAEALAYRTGWWQ